LSLLAVIACVLAIWLPFGFTMTGLIEEWGQLGVMEMRGPDYIPGIGNLSPLVALRPLNAMPFALVNTLSPNSFISWHLLLMTALVVKGGAFSYMIWKVVRSAGFAALAGVLVVVYPAETMQLSFRALHINCSLSLVLLAGSLFIAAWTSDNRRRAQLWAVVAAVLLVVSILMYEAAFTFVVLPFLVIFAADGWRESLNRLKSRAGIVIMWLAGAGTYVVYALWMAHRVASYQGSLIGSKSIFAIMADALPKLFTVGITRAVLGGWVDSVRMVASEFDSYVYLVIAAAIITIIVGFAFRAAQNIDASEPQKETVARVLRLILAGGALMVAGYAPYLLSGSHLAISQRTFLFASPGASMLWVSMLLGISLVAKPATRFIWVGLIFFGLAAQLVQFNHYVRLTEIQRNLLRSIVENFDGNSGNKTLLILDGSNYLGHTWLLDYGNLGYALSYFYQRSMVPVQICHIPSLEWQEVDALGRKGVCMDAGDQWAFRYQKMPSGPGQQFAHSPSEVVLPKDGVVVLKLDVNGIAEKDPRLDEYRKGLFSDNSLTDLRFRNILLEPAWAWYKTIFKDERTQSSYRWSFGNWWSMELPIRGAGWREAEWRRTGLFHEAAAWKVNDKSTLIFEFAPIMEEYLLRGSFEVFANDRIREKTAISLNGSEVPLQWTSSNAFEARVPKNILHSGINRIDFSAPVDDNYYGLSEKLHSFERVPASGI